MASQQPRRVTPAQAVRQDRRRVAVLYHPHLAEAKALACRLAERLEECGARTVLASAWDENGVGELLAGLDWVVSLGGDGSLVRTARLAAAHGIPILGVNFGRLGFLSELEPGEALARVPEVLAGAGWIEERLMLRCTAQIGGREVGPIDAVNDVFVGRGWIPRVVRLEVAVNGARLGRLTADGLLVSTPTGSTAYALSAGGPVIAPTVPALLLTPVASHPSAAPATVLPVDAVVDIAVESHEDATLSVDGHVHHPLGDGDTVRVRAGPNPVHLIRLRGPEHFYETVMERLQAW